MKKSKTVRLKKNYSFQHPMGLQRGTQLRHLIMHFFNLQGVADIDQIYEFCELEYGSHWDVICEFDALQFERCEFVLPRKIRDFLEVRNG